MSGFYGNITDTSNQIFQFDRIFPNRKAMDDAASSGEDGVFTGHFVLVKYNNSGDYLLLNGTNNEYSTNYDIDRTQYGNNFDIRGYDATVWQKIYSNGESKFISVATLNGLMPTIDLIPDAPKQLPAEVYLDKKAPGYGVYVVKVPMQWGFRIKEAENNSLSDQQIIQPKIVYNEESGEYEQISEMINADIYFNKNGGSKMYKSSALNNISDEIILTPTGKSGRLYDGVQKEDYYELGIHLPMIGNMVSDGYDLIYGGNIDEKRPTDILWYNGNVSDDLKTNGNLLLGGKTHDLNTLAGTLNTLHDRLGQIIIPIENDYNINDCSDNNIYYLNNKYYRKGFSYNENQVNEDLFRYDKVENLLLEDFTINKYYEGKGSNIYEPALNYDEEIANAIEPDKGYFLKQINSIRYTPIELEQFVSGQYYLKEGENYYCDNSQYFPSDNTRRYYTINKDRNFIFDQAYDNNGSFYIIDENGNYISYRENNPDRNLDYYRISSVTVKTQRRFYQPNVYYIQTGENSYELATKSFEQFNEYSQFTNFYILHFDMENPQYGVFNGQVVLYYPQIGLPENVGTLTLPGNYFFSDGNGNYLTYNNLANMDYINGYNPYTIERDYFEIELSTPYNLDNLFLPNIYYYENNNHDFIKAINWEPFQTYYLITSTLLNNIFYISDTYYYEESLNIYKLDSSLVKRNVQYYTKSSLYVLSDTYNNCPYGYEWSDYASYIPPSVTLFTKEKIPSLVEMNGLANNEMSINSILLNLEKIYNISDEGSRDKNTLNGALNIANDLLYQIKTLIPGHILYVNDFGQIVSSPITYNQLKNLIN